MREVINSIPEIPEESNDPESLVRRRNEVIKKINKIRSDMISILKNDEPLLEHKLSHLLDDILRVQQEKLKSLVKLVLRTFLKMDKEKSSYIRIDLKAASYILGNKANYEGNQAQEIMIILEEINKVLLVIAEGDNEILLVKNNEVLEINMTSNFVISDFNNSVQRFRNLFLFQRYFSEVLDQNVSEESYKAAFNKSIDKCIEGIKASFSKTMFPFAKDHEAELLSEVSNIETECKKKISSLSFSWGRLY